MTAMQTLDWTAVAVALANHLWQSTAFAAVAVLLALALRNSHARARYWLWMAASLKFLAPFALLVAIGSQVQWSTAPLAIREAVSSVMDDAGAGFAAVALPARPAVGASNSISIPALLLGLWILGCAAVLIGWFARWRRVAAVVRAARPLTVGREMQALQRVVVTTGIRIRIRLASSSSSIEPGIFGITRPVLLLPAGIAGRLSDGQLEAIFTHELCHVRRRDNLAAAIHTMVEAIFWFHPLVWWLRGRLVEERERACDEEVLRLGSD